RPRLRQPLRADDTACFLVIGEVKFERSAELAALRDGRFQRQQRPGIAGKIRFRHRHAASVHDRTTRAVLDDRPVRIEAPSETGRHHVPVGIERDDRPVAEAMADDEIGHALHAGGLNRRARHFMRLDRKTELLQQLLRAFRVRGAIPRRIVARYLYQLGEKFGLAREIAIDERSDDVCLRHDVSASRTTASSMTRAAISASSAVTTSRGDCLAPPFPQRTNSIATSVRPSNIMASWPAPLGRWRGVTPARATASAKSDCRRAEHRTAAVRCTSVLSMMTPRLAAIR